jgi:hypothetical protein
VRRLIYGGVFGIAIAVGCGGRTSDDRAGSGGAATGSGGTTGTATGSGGTTGTTTGGGGIGASGGTGGTTGTGGASGGDAGTDWSACTGAGQCELAMKCCACGILGLDQLTPINSAKRDAFNRQSCGPNPLPCPPCVGVIEPHLMARCESGRCRGFDIRSDPTYTKCGSDQECVLRKGLGCCQCGAPGEWVAVSRAGDMLIGGETCGPGSVCPACIPTPPSGTSAVCRNGVCTKMPP